MASVTQFISGGIDYVWRGIVETILFLPVDLQLLFNVGLQAIQAWQNSTLTQPTPEHIKAIKGLKFWFVDPGSPSGPGVPSEIIEKQRSQVAMLDLAVKEWMKPNIGGITISPTSERMGRSVENSENLIITQPTYSGVLPDGYQTAGKEYVSDNSAPHPRTWHIEGMITQSIPLADQSMGIMKPTLMMQQSMLDAYAQSRKPILFRSGLCPFPTLVLIDDYTLERALEGYQVYNITIDLKEWVTYNVPISWNPAGKYENTAGTFNMSYSSAPVTMSTPI